MSEFIYKPPNYEPQIQNASLGVKFARGVVLLDPWGLMLKGKTRKQRIIFRLKHPISYTSRWFFKLRLKVWRIFVKYVMKKCNLKEESPK